MEMGNVSKRQQPYHRADNKVFDVSKDRHFTLPRVIENGFEGISYDRKNRSLGFQFKILLCTWHIYRIHRNHEIKFDNLTMGFLKFIQLKYDMTF